jgi:hypothetical protein
MMNRMNRLVFLPFLMILLVTATAWSQDDHDLAKASQNPIANMISVPLENWGYFDLGPGDGWAYSLIAKPVYPINVGKLNLINRFIIPVIYLDDQDFTISAPESGEAGGTTLSFSTDSEFGLGNIQYQAFFSPAKPSKVVWGVGPVFEFPTNTDDVLGTDTWSAGPAAVVLAMPGKWVVGCTAQNIWSFKEDDGEPDVNKFTFQYFVNYNLSKGWYLTMTPTTTANWESDSGQKWTVPFGGGMGRLVRFGKLPVDFKLQVYYNAERPDNGPRWSSMFSVKFLFPK